MHALAAVGELSEQGFGGAAEGGCDWLPDAVPEDLLDHQKLGACHLNQDQKIQHSIFYTIIASQ